MACGLLAGAAVIRRRSVVAIALLLVAGRAIASEEADVLVVGGGPGGLAAAIEAKLAGAGRVVVLERRGAKRERRQIVVLGQAGIDHLGRYGVDVMDRDLFTPIDHFTTITEGQPPSRLDMSDPRPPRGRRVASHLLDLVPERHVATIPIHRLEEALIDRARALGIELRFDTKVTDLAIGAHAVRARYEGAGAAATGSIRGAFAVVADGARSPVGSRAGATKTFLPGREQRFAWAIFEGEGRGATLRRLHSSDGPGAPTATLAMRSSHGIGVGLGLPPGVEPGGEALAAYVRRWAKEVGVKGKMVVPPALFTSQAGSTDAVVLGEARGREGRAIVLGDAARHDSPWAGLGTQAALHDAARFGEAYRVLGSPGASRRARRRALARYAARTRRLSSIVLWRGKDSQPDTEPPAPARGISGWLGQRAAVRRVVHLGDSLLANRGRLWRNPHPRHGPAPRSK